MIAEEVARRLGQRHVETIDYGSFVPAELPSLKQAVVGPQSVTDLSRGPKAVRVLLDAAAVPWTPAQWARSWLGLCLEEARGPGMAKRRVPWRNWQLPMLELPAPLHFSGPTTGEWAYIDIDACYYNLYRSLALDLDYRPDGRDSRLGIGRVRFLGSEEVQSKAIRQFVSGIFRSTRPLTIFRSGVPNTGPSGVEVNRFLAPGLWGAMSDSLHAIAAEAVRRGAVYWHTDGGALPLDAAWGFLDWLACAWGLTASIRAKGPGTILGIGTWQIGDVVRGNPRPLRPVSNLRSVDGGASRLLRRVRVS